jgi:hypothetical protein
MNNSFVLHLIVSPSVEYAMADWLLERDEVPGFSSLGIAGHGSSEKSMSVAEQVSGRRRQVLFMVHLAEAEARSLLDAIRAEFRGSGMHYWLLPAADAGHID